MKERPILFSAPMVRACMREKNPKTVTRRMIKAQPHGAGSWVRFGDLFHFPNVCPHTIIKSPYGLEGDSLWVREAWSPPYSVTGIPPRDLAPMEVWYWADGNHPTHGDWTVPKPGIHMPRWASRLTLEITEVRAERLQDITEEEAISEGIVCERVIIGANCNGGIHQEERADRYFWEGCQDEGFESAVEAYADLWDHINGRGSWDANPYVWAVSFRRAVV